MIKLICQKCGNIFEHTNGRKYCLKCRQVGAPESLIGKKFPGSRLTIMEFGQEWGTTQFYWIARCKCDCGTEKWIRMANIKNGRTISCGCPQKESMRTRRKS